MSNIRQCPFDPLHQISAKTFALHLVKCKRQHPEIKLVACYFDTSHLVKEEELKQHMRTCSSRNHLVEYQNIYEKTTIGRAGKQEDPAENLIYNTDASSMQKHDTDGQSLQDDTECWDDFAFKSYDPLANCKSKMQTNKMFILPNPNKFGGQMQAASTTLLETQDKEVQHGSQLDQEEGESMEENNAAVEPMSMPMIQCGAVRKIPSGYDAAASNSKRYRKERHFDEPSSSKQYETKDGSSYRLKSERSFHGTSDCSRSYSTSSSDRKSGVYDEYYDGYTYRGSYDASRGYRDNRKERYTPDTNRGRYHRQGEYPRTSSRSYDSNKHKYDPYQRSQRSYDNRARDGCDYE
ncbi:uncharacterized protein LOC126564953 [Anopheles maculipalpis]|uniref:uncharacterized protein LOC126564953 n=1 Tax=Anopheles maculipalpis TaxID=1496333 RepID=UPI002159AE8B|nr:uncharacterized protein LOC126564953 [Anopheles maculipalpis]